LLGFCNGIDFFRFSGWEFLFLRTKHAIKIRATIIQHKTIAPIIIPIVTKLLLLELPEILFESFVESVDGVDWGEFVVGTSVNVGELVDDNVGADVGVEFVVVGKVPVVEDEVGEVGADVGDEVGDEFVADVVEAVDEVDAFVVEEVVVDDDVVGEVLRVLLRR